MQDWDDDVLDTPHARACEALEEVVQIEHGNLTAIPGTSDEWCLICKHSWWCHGEMIRIQARDGDEAKRQLEEKGWRLSMPGRTTILRFWSCPTCALQYEDKKTITVAHLPYPGGAPPPPPGAPAPNSVRPPDPPGLVTHQLEEFEDTSVAVVSDELSYRWKQAEVIEELKAEVDKQAEVIKELKVGLQVGQLQVGQLQAEVDKQAEVIDDLKAIVNELKLQVGHHIVLVDVVESC